MKKHARYQPVPTEPDSRFTSVQPTSYSKPKTSAPSHANQFFQPEPEKKLESIDLGGVCMRSNPSQYDVTLIYTDGSHINIGTQDEDYIVDFFSNYLTPSQKEHFGLLNFQPVFPAIQHLNDDCTERTPCIEPVFYDVPIQDDQNPLTKPSNCCHIL